MSDRPEEFAHLVMRVSGELHAALHRGQAGSGQLGRPAFGLLGYLHAMGGSTLSRAAEDLHMAKSQLSITVEKLVEMGCVEREPVEDDRRVAALRVTERGEQALAEAYAEVRSRVERLFSPLDGNQMATVREAFGILAVTLEERGKMARLGSGCGEE
ncbi:MAG TPA: MarR family winged helix-turn-helix transcriptional regulator [Rectinemataceae bacterium]|nr:MarR family winged helix-turn-helix transcriptional regulator [Rectinemataceae bacterium]